MSRCGSSMRFFLPLKSVHKVGLLCLLSALWNSGSFAQSPPSSEEPQGTQEKSAAPASALAGPHPKDEATAEVATRDAPATFKVHANLVQVRVVVRDQNGKVIPDLHREDFQIFDNRKPQLLSTFDVDTVQPRPTSLAVPANPSENAAEVEKTAIEAKLPQRFVALVFDDVHLLLEDVPFVRSAATKFFDSLAPSDRVGIYSTSGQTTQEFTDDRAILRKTLLGILPHSAVADFRNCPDVTYYQADQIVNSHNGQALTVAVEDAISCAFNGDETKVVPAEQLAKEVARTTLSVGDAESTSTYSRLSDITRRLVSMPGQRIMVFVSPGFIPSTLWPQMTELIDRANHGKITINTIDARGLYTPDLAGDIASATHSSPYTFAIATSFRLQAQSAQDEVLADLAHGTGGTYFHNRNDLDEGMKQAGAAPEISYLLGFSPQNFKIDGKFHEIKVTLTGKREANIQARRGYYAPRTVADPAAAAKAAIEDAIFSQYEIHDLPVDLETQFFKKDSTNARIAVLTHFDLKGVHFRKAEGRSNDNLTIATAIFDQNGNFVTGGEKILEMKLLDSTYDRLSRSGVTVKSSFDVKPGTYVVRLVVRDGEGEQMAARNGAVVIPF
jgi:VWFA-related protein